MIKYYTHIIVINKNLLYAYLMLLRLTVKNNSWDFANCVCSWINLDKYP